MNQSYAFPPQMSTKYTQQKEYIDNLMRYKNFQAHQAQQMHFMNQMQALSLLNSLQNAQQEQYNFSMLQKANESFSMQPQKAPFGFEYQIDTPPKETFLKKKDVKLLFKSQVVDMLKTILSKTSFSDKIEIAQLRMRFSHSHALLRIFDVLIAKYGSISKCREDMVRFVLRKALSYIRNTLKEQHKLTNRAASILLCQRYFEKRAEEMSGKDIDLEDEEEIINFLLPYKKNSRNKTANACFITEIFSSEAFYQDYLTYLDKFEEIYNTDNEKKIEKFADFLINCAEDSTLEKVRTYKRLPWLKTWQEASKVIAYELLSQNIWKFSNKKTKIEN